MRCCGASVRRILVTLMLLAVGIAVPATVLVLRALESARNDERSRHRAVADRAFDEMETSLSQFLRIEEGRPFGEYRFYEEVSPDEPRRRRRSPLSLAPQHAFVIGYFQIEPDGSLRTPRRPENPTLAQQLGDYQPSPEIEQLESTLREAWTTAQRRTPQIPSEARQLVEALRPGVALTKARRTEKENAERDQFRQAAPSPSRSPSKAAEQGLTPPLPVPSADTLALADEQGLNLLGSSEAKLAEGEPSAALEAKDGKDTTSEQYSSYDVLRSFNLARERRSQRKQKVQVERAPLVAPPQAAEATPEPAFSQGAKEADRADAGLRFSDALEEDALPASPQSPRKADAVTVRVALDPMMGRRADDDSLLLYRTVVAGKQGYRQGLLVNWRALGAWLDEEVIARSPLAGASTVAFFGEAKTRSAPLDGTYGYRHRFAEPFDAFGVELQLEPLPGGGGTDTIHALAILLAVVGAGGLFAVYRMVSVVVEFAERRSRFVAAVSHELKTPLTSIRMYGEMLRDGIVSGEEKRDEYYRTITDESERLSRLIDNVLDFSRLEKGERVIQPHAGPLQPVVLEAVEKLRPHAENQGFALVPRCDPDLPEVRFDRDVVTQVIFNLVDNALKYAQAAERREIEISCHAAPGEGVTLSVCDHGPGVPKEELARLFEPFYRREDELTRTTKGTGIGLALVKELAEAMGGRIEASLVEGGGLRVTIELAPMSAP